MDFSAPHAVYVYAAYGISLICILGLLVVVLRYDKAIRKKLENRKDND
ncbi:MAG: heme exporter protein CcmD [Alphaproteobacteria bacterium]|nr:heme exporter protein CcmD [Alphaproteobacteria bacterium]